MKTRTPPQTPENPLIVKNNSYYLKKGNTEKRISNFTMSVPYLLDSPTNPRRVIKLVNDSGEEISFDVPADGLVTTDSFSRLVEKKGNFVFTGSKQDLAYLKEYLYKEEKKAISLDYLGYHQQGLFVFSNGIFDCAGKFHSLDSDGIIHLNDHTYYVPFGSKQQEPSDSNGTQAHKLFHHKPGEVSIDIWAGQLFNVFGEKAKIGIAYLIAAFYRDIIFEQVSFFPHLFLIGMPQTGKTNFRAQLMRLYGEEQKSIHCGMGSTQKALSRKLGQLSNALVSCEEYKNTIDPRLIETMKGIYDGDGYERAFKSNDTQTFTSLVKSALVVTGQELPTQENALMTRGILLYFTQTQYSNEERIAFEQLNDLSNQGLTQIVGQLMTYRTLIERQFSATFSTVAKYLKEKFASEKLSERLINNYACIVTPLYILQSTETIKLPFATDAAISAASELMTHHGQLVNATNEINQFWSVVKLLKNDAMTGEKYHIEKIIEKKDCFCIRFEMVYDKYREHCIKRKLSYLDRATLSAYLKNDKAFVKGNRNGGGHAIAIDSKSTSFFCFDKSLLPGEFFD